VEGDDVQRIPVRIEPDRTTVDDPPGEVATRDRTVHHLPVAGEPIIGPGPTVVEESEVVRPRLARHEITLSDGHTVGVALCGRGVPLVVVHGFTAEGILYAQTLSRLVGLGFKVVAIDAAGHGGTLGLPTDAQTLENYTGLLAQVLDHLGIETAVLAGHSMGGRLVTELAAREPDRAIALILIDAIVGDAWDRRVNLFRIWPPALGLVAAGLVVDTVATLPLFRDPAQAAKLIRLVTPTLIGHARRPWRLLAPGVSILRSRGSRWMLDKLGHEQVPVVAVHGEHDFAVPLSTARSTARRTGGELVVVERAWHSWLLRDPETLPAIVQELMSGRLGEAVRQALVVRGVDPATATPDDVEGVLYAADALALELTPRQQPVPDGGLHRTPRYRWRTEAPRATVTA
jgi:pimeloyl-ACP methyl ester carboxylesterase